VPARVIVLDFHGGRHLGLVKAGGIDVLSGEASQDRGERAFTRSSPLAQEVSEGSSGEA
jgi:cytolysin (calcineurin-like family phosphatase)